MRKLVILVILIAASSADKYVVSNFMANWFKAVEYCNYLGERLAIVASYENQTELTEMVTNTDKFNSISTEVWIGASDLAQKGYFTWQATGTGVRYSNWKRLRPYNADSVVAENCVEVRHVPSEGWKWQWNVADCRKLRYFVCEDTKI